MNRILVFIIFTLFINRISAQVNSDSLLTVYQNKQASLEARLEALTGFYTSITRYHPDSALNLADEGIGLAKKNDLIGPCLELSLQKANTLNLQKREYETATTLYKEIIKKGKGRHILIGRSYLGLAVLLTNNEKFEASEAKIEAAIAEFRKEKNIEGQRFIGVAHINQAIIYRNQGKYQKAMELSRSAFQELRKDFPSYAGAAARNTGNYHTSLGNYDSAIWYYRAIAPDPNDMLKMSWLHHNTAVVFELMNRNDSAIKHYTSAIRISKRANNPTQMGLSFQGLAVIYLQDRNFGEAHRFADKAIEVLDKVGGKILKGSAYGMKGKIFLVEEEFDSAQHYFFLELKLARETNNLTRLGQAHKDLGSYNMEIKDYPKSIEFYDSAASYFVMTGEAQKRDESLLEKSRGLLALNDGREALNVLIPMIPNLENERPLKVALIGFELLSESYALLKVHDSTTYYLRKSISIKDSLVLLSNKKIENEALAKFQVELTKKEKDLITLKASKIKIRLYYALGVIGLSLLFIFLIIKRHFKYKREKEKTTQLKVEAAERYVDHTREILQNQSGLILEKNRIINELKETMQIHFGGDQAEIAKFDHLLEQKILTKADWEKFKSSFEILYPKFIETAKNKYESITEAEVRMLCMFKLDLSIQEMADMLGILPRSMQRTVYRFKNKYNITSEDL